MEDIQGTLRLVSVVDDDESVRESLPDLLKELGFDAATFSSAEEFLQSELLDKTRCLLLDVTMPGMSGPELQQELARRGMRISIVFITAHTDPSLRSTLLAQGALDCLFKPLSEDQIIRALQVAMPSPP